MAKKTPTNYGQTGIIEEVGFFRGDKKTAEEIEGFKKELTILIYLLKLHLFSLMGWHQ